MRARITSTRTSTSREAATSTVSPNRSSSCGRSSPSSGFIVPTSTNRASWRMRDAVALDVHPAHRRGVEQHVDQMVVQQVDLVDVEHAAVRAGQQAGRERMLAVAQHLLQVQRSDHAVLGGADRQLDEPRAVRRHRVQHRGQRAHRRRLGGALLPADQHPADLRAHRAQHQRQPQPVLADDRAERVAGVQRSTAPPRTRPAASARAGCRRRGTRRRRGRIRGPRYISSR